MIRGNAGTLSIAAILAAVAILTGCSGETKKDESGPAIQAQLGIVEQSMLPSRYQAVGTLRSVNVANLAPKVMGNIMRVHVSEGDFVRRGQTLVEIDSRDVDAQYDKARAGLDEIDRALAAGNAASEAAQANLSLAEGTYKRYEVLKERNSVSPQEFEEVATRYKAAAAGARQAEAGIAQVRAKRRQVEADIATAAAYRSYATITAPFDGVVAARNAEVGNQVAPGMPLITVEEQSKYRVESFVTESEVGRLHVGDIVIVRIDALGRSFEGRVAQIAPNVDSATRTYLVKTDVHGVPGVQLRSGLFASVAFNVGSANGLSVPASAIVTNGELETVFVVDSSGVARMRIVKTGREFDGKREVLSGLETGERIVTVPGREIRDGVRVENAEKRS